MLRLSRPLLCSGRSRLAAGSPSSQPWLRSSLAIYGSDIGVSSISPFCTSLGALKGSFGRDGVAVGRGIDLVGVLEQLAFGDQADQLTSDSISEGVHAE